MKISTRMIFHNGLRQRGFDPLVLSCVLAAAALVGATMYLHYLDIAHFRWGRMENDRNAHYLLGLSLALDIRTLDISALLADLDSARVWPPLHGALVAVALLLGGFDYRLGVLPSLAGWIGTVVLGFMVARRAVSAGGNLAGVVAAIFIVASPAHRIFATDIMLESLGSCLSLAVMYLYLIAIQESSARSYRKLALALTALFLLKYNYWFLVVAGLLAAHFLSDPKRRWASLCEMMAGVDWRARMGEELRSPFVMIALASLFLMALVMLSGGWKFELWGRTVSIRSHHNLLQVAYGALFLRGILWWKSNGRVWIQKIDSCTRALVLWHLWPVALWLLLPKHLGYFLHFLSPANGANSPANFLWGLDFYWNRLQQDYHTESGSALVAFGLVVVAVWGIRKLNRGTAGIVLFVVLAALLTVAHPNRKSRFLHSWIPAAWVLAGAGASLACNLISGRRKYFLATAIAGVLAVWQLRDPLSPGHSPEDGHRAFGPVILELSDFYLPLLSDSRHATFMATVPVRHFAQWTFLEKYRERNRINVFLKGFGASAKENQRLFEQWLRATPSDTIVFLDVPPGSTFYFRGEPFHQQYRDLLSSQSVFQRAEERFFRRYGCTVSLWRRTGHAGGDRSGPA